jgi:hypothetical protein
MEKLTLADLVSLYNNYRLVEISNISIGSRFLLLSKSEMEKVEREIEKRLEMLDI